MAAAADDDDDGDDRCILYLYGWFVPTIKRKNFLLQICTALARNWRGRCHGASERALRTFSANGFRTRAANRNGQTIELNTRLFDCGGVTGG